ncbi:hypothetical protein K502DRAFT_325856 [Neoconidiobolus thromboides FSU 785]|nr:hypothetical protein K502DRAFT_325856 [Neoconidiobolus thromboides FSU 785]
MERLDPELIVLRSERAEQEAARMIREQQDMAYQNSLLADQEKAKRREKQREEEEREERRLKVEFENKALQARYHYLYHNKLLQQLSLEPNSSEPNVSRFSIRLLNGERAIRRFRASDTILDLYEYVETLLPLEEDAPTTPHSESIDELPDGYQHQFLFRLHSAFPRTCIEPTETVLSETNFWPGANLMVESIYLD